MNSVMCRYRFGPFEVDVSARELRRVDGRGPTLRGQPVELLLLLLEKPHEVVTRDVIVERLWGTGKIGAPPRVKTIVRILRRFLGDTKHRSLYVGTVGRVGYRFNLQHLEAESEGPSVSSQAALSGIQMGEEKNAAAKLRNHEGYQHAQEASTRFRLLIGLVQRILEEKASGAQLTPRQGFRAAIGGGIIGGLAVAFLFLITPNRMSGLPDPIEAMALAMFVCFTFAPAGGAAMCFFSFRFHQSASQCTRSIIIAMMVWLGGALLLVAHLVAAVPGDRAMTAEWLALYVHGAIASTVAIRAVNFLAVNNGREVISASARSALSGGFSYSTIVASTNILARVSPRLSEWAYWNWQRLPFVIACTFTYVCAILFSMVHERKSSRTSGGAPGAANSKSEHVRTR